ncbi:type II toxin-antitoxin system RelE/ParE family toxin [Candidatus Woesearchaeota archaeon]|nr:type II toxin-antitoxin system RelE/ParE family toxin [Candidatus Woesearchaeota archaeon]
MSYQVHLSKNADEFLEKLDKHLNERIKKRLIKLAENPIPTDAKFITRDKSEDKIFRYRIGEYRALYKIKEKERIVLIAEIDKRPRIYDKIN